MDDDNLMDVNLTDLDLNLEPVDPRLRSVASVDSLLNELDTAQEMVEERIRQLESVSARERQRQERNSVEISRSSSEMIVNVNSNSANRAMVESTAEKGKGCRRDSSHLVAKALEMDSEVKKADKEGGSFYDCNICLDLAREPVLTCCGHLFCWACFYQVSNVDSTSKECPVCKGEVSERTVIPIYGNGVSERVCETESGLKIPPRPKAPRVESVRQQRVTHSLSNVPVEEALRRIRVSIGAMGYETQQQEGGNGILSYETESHEGRQNVEGAGSGRVRIHQVSRVLSESAASLSSLSSALSSAERLVEDLETVINSRMSRNDTQASSVVVGDTFTRHFAVLQSNDQLQGSTSGFNAALPVNPSSESTGVSGSDERILMRRTSSGIGLPVAPSYSLRRRRSITPRNSDVDSRDTREARRRRLN